MLARTGSRWPGLATDYFEPGIETITGWEVLAEFTERALDEEER